MNVLTRITCDLIRKAAPPIVYAVQYDRRSRLVEVRLTENRSPWFAPPDIIGIVNVQKPDGTVAFYENDETGAPAVLFSGSIVTITLTAQALAAAGEALVSVSFYGKEAERLTVFAFRLLVEASVIEDESITSSNYYNVLTNEIQTVLAAADRVSGVIDIKGTYQTLAALMDGVKDARQGDMYCVGASEPYTVYMWDQTASPGRWLSQGALRGPQGLPGTGLTVAGHVQSASDLENLTDAPQIGQAYSVGSQTPYDIYIYTEDGWENHGPLQGVQGPTGAQGQAGEDGQSAFAAAQEGGYTGTQAQFYADLAAVDGLSAWFAGL